MTVSCSSHQNAEISGLGWIVPDLQVSVEPEAPLIDNFTFTITSEDGVYSHTWPTVESFQDYESFQVGSYVAKAVSGQELAEGYNCACYVGETKFQVTEAARTEVLVHCTLTQAMWKLALSEKFNQAFPNASFVAHVAECEYVDVDKGAVSPLLLIPGETYFFFTIQDAQGRSVSVIPDLKVDTAPASSYLLSVDYDGSSIIASCGAQESSIVVDDALFDSTEPWIVCEGFESNETINLIEGYPSEQQIKMTAHASGRGLQSVILTVMSDPAGAISYVGEYNLFGQSNAVKEAGLQVTQEAMSLEADFTQLLENINIDQNTVVTFVMQARDLENRVSPVAILRASISSIDLAPVSQTPAIVGVNKAQIVLQATAPDVEEKDIAIWELDGMGNALKELPIETFEMDPVSLQLSLGFSVDPGINPVPIRVDFMGLPKLTAQVERQVPDFSIGVDPFATSALIVVTAETPEITEALLQYMKVYANGNPTTVSSRQPEYNLLWITGLQASTTYTLQAEIIEGQNVAEAKIVTEGASQMPMGDFEDVEEDFKYGNLPCGGSYSAAAFPIYNQQNYMDWVVWWPTKYWASVNDKTFCRQAKNHNSWYMQPSSVIDFDEYVSGSKSIRISSVGWSLNGEEIPPYMQEEGEYVPYNENVPNIDHRSAGKLFLGSYSFNSATCTETYTQGMAFSSRPYSLNGFYKYDPDPSYPEDEGYVEIELINDAGSEPLTIARATQRLSATPAFVAFNLPLTYDIIGVKATRLKVLFASTVNQGDMASEDESVTVTANVPNAWFRGSTLWIDNLSFAY